MTVSCAGAAGATSPGAAAPPAASGSGPATATTTSASASVAPQDRAIKGRNTVASGGEASPSGAKGGAERKPPTRATAISENEESR
jgi:hypothetical protein